MFDIELLHQKIKKIRGKITQENFSERFGLSAKFLSDVENNKKNLSTFSFINFLNTLNISYEEFINNKTEQEIIKCNEILDKIITLNFNQHNKKLLLDIIIAINRKGI